MKNWLKAAIFGILVLNGSLARANTPPAKPGVIEKVGGIDVLHVFGSPYEMGYQHGQAMKPKIQVLVKNFLGRFVYPRTRNKNYLWERTKAMIPTMPPAQVEEAKGIADGAGVTYEEILMAHTYVDVLTRMGCSFFAAKGPATKDGNLVLARNLDWTVDKELQDAAVVVVYHPKEGQSFLSFTYTGMVGIISGVNASGQMVEINLSPNLENSWEGRPMLMTLREALEKGKSLDEVQGLITAQKRIAGFNIQIGSGPQNEARTLELSAKKVNVVKEKSGLLITTNHFTDPQMYMKNIPYFNSKDRYLALRVSTDENKGKIGSAKAKELIHGPGVKLDKTVHSFVWAPKEDLFSIWALDKTKGWVDLKPSVLFNKKPN